MKSSIRSFVLAAIAAVATAGFAHSASAQVFSSTAANDHQLGGGAVASTMVLYLPYAGPYMITGQQMVFNTGNQPEFVYCWISTTNGSTSSVPYGPLSGGVIPVGGVATFPLGGSYTASGPVDLWVVCRNSSAAGTSAFTTVGNITANYY